LCRNAYTFIIMAALSANHHKPLDILPMKQYEYEMLKSSKGFAL